MNIWIVEDDDNDARKAVGAIASLGLESVSAFRNRSIRWDGDLMRMPWAAGEPPVNKIDHMPAIVILDLLDEDLQFAAGRFYDSLRREETGHQLPAAFVIAWSVKTGLPSVSDFLKNKPIVDRRLSFTNTKNTVALEAALAHNLQAWREAQLL
jgi:hypothetical protein